MSLPNQCPLCHAGIAKQTVVTPHVYGAKDNKHSFFHCEACDVRYMHPGLTPEEESRFYAAEFEGFMAGRAGSKGGWEQVEDHIRANEPTRLRRMKYLAPNINGKMKILEMGCSSGFMMLPLIREGHTCVGVEPSGVFSEHLQKNGLNVYQSMDQMKKNHPEMKFNLIQHFFVLEHIADPLPFLQAQMELLERDGKLIFEIPNAEDPLYTIYDIPAFERFYWSIAHPWYFNEKSLHFLLENLGYKYEILRDQRYDLSNHMIWARDGRPGGMGRFSEKLGTELDESYKQSLIKSGKCDTLIGVITKNR